MVSIGLLASASVGKTNALFEPIHGSYPQAKGKDIANPIASILSAAMLLEHFGLYEESATINKAVNKALESKIVTVDLNKDLNYSTEVVGDTIAEFILNKNIEINNIENLKIGKSVLI